MVSQDYQDKALISQLLSLDEARVVVHLKGDGLIKVFRVIPQRVMGHTGQPRLADDGPATAVAG